MNESLDLLDDSYERFLDGAQRQECFCVLLHYGVQLQERLLDAHAHLLQKTFVLDRWHLAKYVIWLKNRPWPGSDTWYERSTTGFPPDTPPWLAGWLLIIVDNTLHVLINGVAIYYLG